VHVTLRTREDVPSLRRKTVFPVVAAAIHLASGEDFRVVHYSVQGDHLHLLVEAADKERLSRGMQGLAIRIARAANRALGRKGAVFADRYHARALRTPREVRNAIIYVLCNRTKHVPRERGIDPCSSGAWFDGWMGGRRAPPPALGTAVPGTWLLAVGWRRYGLVGAEERPAGPPS
jgi:hypothetical protein